MTDEVAAPAGQNIVISTNPSSMFRSPVYRVIYSNTFKLRITATDVSIDLAMLVGHPLEPAKMAFQEEAAVVLSWGQAKALMDHLTKIVAAFEKKNGPILVNPTSGLNEGTAEGLLTNIRLAEKFEN